MMLRQYYLVYRLSRWVRNHFTYLGHVVLIVMLLSAAFGIDTAATTTYQLFILILVLLVLAFLNSRLTGLDVSAVRHLPRYFTAGEKGHYTVSLGNLSKTSYQNLALIEQLQAEPPGASELDRWFQLSRKPFFKRALGFKRWRNYFTRKRGGAIPEMPVSSLPATGVTRRLNIEIEFTPLRRGKLSFEDICIALPDRLGLYRRLIFILDYQSCLILPRRYPVCSSGCWR